MSLGKPVFAYPVQTQASGLVFGARQVSCPDGRAAAVAVVNERVDLMADRSGRLRGAVKIVVGAL